MTLASIFLIAWGFSAFVMLLLWMVQYKTENAGIVDVAWSFLTPVVGVWLILMDQIENGRSPVVDCWARSFLGLSPRRFLI